MARTAVVAGTATAVSNRVSRRQAGRWAQQEQEQYPQQGYNQGYAAPPQQAPPPQAPPPASSSMDDTLAQLKELGELRDRGLLSEAEFEVQKRKILG
jgi:hypothetical protein